MLNRIYIFGASGSGATSLGKAVCERIGFAHFDADDYLWLPTDEPYSETRTPEEYIEILGGDLRGSEKWILSGHISFGLMDEFTGLYELVVFLRVPPEIRMERLRRRERERYGNEILPGGRRHEASIKFLDYAAEYDEGTLRRSLREHLKWLESLKCPVLKIENDSFRRSAEAIVEAIGNQSAVN